ncbi:MAG: alpha/beta fold hydrolase [Candidatus Sericytochromatia bacterium]|uniref:Alpha/beta fold hydrolase n=1 Tax=Candidatus Tanganyikabacteria bacterium TaxID=2961651 RepID=A0A937X3A4_9BACT|nr:alpha/beta fold hydrolase [Candidatus Tanganyikabacteria bacterium]
MTPFTRSPEETADSLSRAAKSLLKLNARPPVGLTPKDPIWAKNKARLYRYRPTGGTVRPTPILLVYALINKPYIMDLTPGNSLVESLVEDGYDVFLLDWGVPGEEDAGLGYDSYLFDYLPRAVRAMLKAANAERFTLFGYCMGGTIAAMYAATQPSPQLANLVLLTTPIDFAQAGLYSAWLEPEHFDATRVSGTLRLIPPEMIDLGAKLLKPLQNYVGPYVRLLEKIEDEDFVKGWKTMNFWVNDGVPFPGEAYRQWVTWFYQENRLVRGELSLRGVPVRLENIRCSVLNVYAQMDHIVPPEMSTPFLALVGSQDKADMPVKAGHVGVVAGRTAHQHFIPKLKKWLESRT